MAGEHRALKHACYDQRTSTKRQSSSEKKRKKKIAVPIEIILLPTISVLKTFIGNGQLETVSAL